MKITQAHVTSDMFRPHFLQKFNLQPISDTHIPAAFFGIYQKQIPRIMTIKAPVVCIWVGTDCLQAVRNPEAFEPLFQRTDAIHIAISDVCSKSLALTPIGQKHVIIPITPFTYHEFKPTPLGNAVHYYGLETNRAVYNIETFNYVKNMLKPKNIEFLHTQSHELTRHLMPEFYSQTFCNLRITMHDGFPNTVIEMALMGRHSLWNGSAPGAHPWNSFTDIYNFIIQQKQASQPDTLLSQQMRDFINIPSDWLIV
jgi:hypothetical protein